jgi:hypothetical protein
MINIIGITIGAKGIAGTGGGSGGVTTGLLDSNGFLLLDSNGFTLIDSTQ